MLISAALSQLRRASLSSDQCVLLAHTEGACDEEFVASLERLLLSCLCLQYWSSTAISLGQVDCHPCDEYSITWPMLGLFLEVQQLRFFLERTFSSKFKMDFG